MSDGGKSEITVERAEELWARNYTTSFQEFLAGIVPGEPAVFMTMFALIRLEP